MSRPVTATSRRPAASGMESIDLHHVEAEPDSAERGAEDELPVVPGAAANAAAIAARPASAPGEPEQVAHQPVALVAPRAARTRASASVAMPASVIVPTTVISEATVWKSAEAHHAEVARDQRDPSRASSVVRHVALPRDRRRRGRCAGPPARVVEDVAGSLTPPRPQHPVAVGALEDRLAARSGRAAQQRLDRGRAGSGPGRPSGGTRARRARRAGGEARVARESPTRRPRCPSSGGRRRRSPAGRRSDGTTRSPASSACDRASPEARKRSSPSAGAAAARRSAQRSPSALAGCASVQTSAFAGSGS